MAVWTVPSGRDFASAFAEGFRARHGGADPMAVQRIRIFVNTPRAARRIEDALAAQAGGSALLPRLSPVEALGADPLGAAGLPPAIPPLRRRLELIRLVEAYLATTEGAGSAAAAPALASELAALLDEMDEEGVDPARLDGLAEGHAEHWGRVLAFLEIVRTHWPAIRAEREGGAPDPRARQRAAVAALAADWEVAPPADPVIVASTTGVVASTAALIAAVSRLPAGEIVLPGLETALAPGIAAVLDADGAPEHPQAPFVRLRAALGAALEAARPWVGTPAPLPERRRLLAEALRPAPVTDAWRAALPGLGAEAEAATAGLSLLEAAHPREEAGAIALAIREALQEPGLHIALVTPDAQLARRVATELSRFRIAADDSMGRPLSLSPPGVLARLLLHVAAEPPDPVRIAGLVSHPMVRLGRDRAEHLALARRYERDVLRRTPAIEGEPGSLPGWQDPDGERGAWLEDLRAAIGLLGGALAGGAALPALAGAHSAALTALTAGAGGEAPDDRASPLVSALLARLAQAGGAYGEGSAAAVYPTLLEDLLAEEEERPEPMAAHPRVALLGPREARTHDAGLVILAGLSEGVWPAPADAGPWLSRPMRAALGLPPPERRIGLSAHDFVEAAMRPRAILSRSERRGGAPALPSRWLVRLTGLLAAVGEGRALGAMRGRGERLVALARTLHRPEAPVPPAPRPHPRPPSAAIPRTLSATTLERLVTDPYAVYAREVLRLRPLDPLGRPPDARDRGSVIHTILHRFTEATADGLPPDGEAQRLLLALAEDTLASAVGWPDQRRLWRGRLARAAPAFLAGERNRRAAGEPARCEHEGRIGVAAPLGPVLLHARADRVDRLHDGGWAVYDYKTGAPPGPTDLKRGTHHQIPLAAAMAATGGMEGVDPGPVPKGAYVGLDPKGSVTDVPGLEEGRAAYLAALGRLLAAYDDGAPYTARARPDLAAPEGDHDHLSRRAEWEGEA